jgi:hypothetical protein
MMRIPAALCLAGCDDRPPLKPVFVRGDEVLLAPDDTPALVLSVACDTLTCEYWLRLPGLKEKYVVSELGMRRRP